MRKSITLTLISLLVSTFCFAVSSITGPSTVCVGSSITLTDSTTGGSWTSSLTSVATVGSTNGVVMAISPGTTTISYITSSGTATMVVSVNPVPGAISGPGTMCVGGSATLADATTGGTWISGNTSRATVGSLTGIVTAVTAGTVNIYYSVGGCGTYKIMTINAAPAAIGGPGTVCVGSTISLTNSVSGGLWSSSNTAVASVSSATGVVTGNTVGTATITYTLTTGCSAYKVVSVTSAPAAISGPSTVCVGSTITLTDATTGGSWTSGMPTFATVGPATGIVTGIGSGVAQITYTISGCGSVVKMISVNPAPAAISGPSTVCVGSVITLTDATTGGAWVSSNTSIGSVGSTTGIVTGVSAGAVTISYYAGGCITTKIVNVTTSSPITGSSTVCVGASITLADSVSGGSWSSSTPSVATVGSTTGVVVGIAPGTANIYYVAGGCAAAKTVSVVAAPAAITGPGTVCVGSAITLADATSGGYWTSSATSIASVTTTGGVVTGMSAGVVTISYNTACGTATKIVSVNAGPAAIGGSSTVCVGTSITLTDATSGGAWISSNTSVATIGSTTGVVTGITTGGVTISYYAGGCIVTKSVYVIAATPISGSSTVCAGSSITLTDSMSGGTWSSSNISIATVGATSGVVTGVAAGTTTIYYVSGGCAASMVISVTAAPAAIAGSSSVCVGSSITLTDATTGGVWTSSNTAIAAVSSTGGVVTGTAAGVATISYTISGCGSATKIISVNAAPAAIAGASTVCAGASTTLTDATGGGSWTSSNTAIATISPAGVVTGVAPGTVNIYYVVGGCGVYKIMTVNAAPAAIAGPGTVCVGSTITLSNTATGGTWSSSNASVATITAAGVVTGVTSGTVNIYYQVGGCGTYKIVSVTASPAAIAGSSTVCAGSAISLTDATAGGSWSSSITSLATVGATSGIVTGVATGVVTIYYTVPGCGAVSKVVSVTASPAAITGTSTVCSGSTVALIDATSGGSWSSSNPSVATVNATTGVVTGVAAGTVTIYYTVGSCSVYKMMTVNALPAAISGPSSVCTGLSATLTDAISGGSWSSSNVSVATINATSGVLTGVAAGTVNIYYSVGGCAVYKIMTVTAASSPISGSSSVCAGATIVLTDATGGGTWTSTSTTIATVGVTSGVVTGVSAGVVTIYYVAGGCSASKVISVNAMPSAITGSSSICAGTSTTFTNSVTGGAWSSSNPSSATINTTSGVATGVAAGITTITYTKGGCSVTKAVSVVACAGKISGTVTDGAGKGTSGGAPVAGMTIKLKYASDGSTAFQSSTDATGMYQFQNLADGSYYVYPEMSGYTTVPSAPLSITNSSSVADNINFKLNSTTMTINPVATGLYAIEEHSNIAVYPNPSNGMLFVKWDNQAVVDATVVVTDLTGREVSRIMFGNGENSGITPLNLSKLTNGIYLVMITSEHINYKQKISIQQ